MKMMSKLVNLLLMLAMLTVFDIPAYAAAEETDILKLDSFDTDTLNGWDMTDGTIADGVLKLETSEELTYPLKRGLRWKNNSALSTITGLIKNCEIVMKIEAKLTLNSTGAENGFIQLDFCSASSGDGVSLVRLVRKDDSSYNVMINTTENGLNVPEKLVAEGIKAGTWVDVKLLVFGNTVEYYIDGKPVGGCLFTANRPQVSGGIRICANNGSEANPLSGACDDWRVCYRPIKSNTVADKLPVKENFDIYLFIGQSNMAGRARLEPYDIPAIDNALLLNADNKWELAEAGVANKMLQGLNRYSTIESTSSYNGVNPAGEFARFTAKAYPGKTVGIVSNARGNTTIEQWAKGAGTGYYEAAVERAKAAMEHGTLKGIIWHQGESNHTTIAGYTDKLAAIIADLRADLGIENLPFVAGELCDSETAQNRDNLAAFNTELAALPQKAENCAVVSSEDTDVVVVDYIHMNAESQRLMGVRFAQEMYRLINGSYNPDAYVYEAVGSYIGGKEKPAAFEASVVSPMATEKLTCYLAQYSGNILKSVDKAEFAFESAMQRVKVAVQAREQGSTGIMAFLWDNEMTPVMTAVNIAQQADALYEEYFSGIDWRAALTDSVGEEVYNVLDWTDIIMKNSTATGDDTITMDGYSLTRTGKYEITAADAGFVRSGEYAGQICSTGDVIECKNDEVNAALMRKAVIKFDISALPELEVGAAYVDVYCTSLSVIKPAVLTAYEMNDSTWHSMSLTWNNLPAEGAALDSTPVLGTERWCRLDVTEALSDVFGQNEYFSVLLQENACVRMGFGGMTSAYAPRLTVIKARADGQKPDFARENTDGYKTVTEVKASVTSASYSKRPTRVLSDLPNFNRCEDFPETDTFGGIIDGEPFEATGFFRIEKIDGRWWLVTPEGNKFISIGLNSVKPGASSAELAAVKEKYGTTENWTEETTNWLWELGFNTAGGFSRPHILKTASHQLSYTPVLYFMKSYAEKTGQSVAQAGHAGFANNNTMPVFDPAWVDFCDEYAREQTAAWLDDAHILGWMSDNELPVEDDMLVRYLTLDPSKPANIYSYAAAWEWFSAATKKKNPTVQDITPELRDAWREFVYDRYYSVVSSALKKNDPNHLYLGSRHMGRGYRSKGMMRAAGRYCDAVTVNYYNAWTPDPIMMEQWQECTGKPFIITEWYAMGMDSGMGNETGAGWIVKTQSERGDFYQSFALGLLENKNCIGFHWFQYRDNDPGDSSADASNKNSNKGIVTLDLTPYEPLTEKMREFNKNVYEAIDYFAGKR